VIHTTDADTGIDLYIGQGGAPEGVLAASALKCIGGQFQGRLVFRNDDERARARRLGLADKDFDRKYNLDDLVPGDVIFAATGVTDGAMLDGVKIKAGMIHTHTLVMSAATREVREIRMVRPL
jgi:fructose-1,6-bisphosphatase II / sedoheptulose-1,7-bisphosphatase